MPEDKNTTTKPDDKTAEPQDKDKPKSDAEASAAASKSLENKLAEQFDQKSPKEQDKTVTDADKDKKTDDDKTKDKDAEGKDKKVDDDKGKHKVTENERIRKLIAQGKIQNDKFTEISETLKKIVIENSLLKEQAKDRVDKPGTDKKPPTVDRKVLKKQLEEDTDLSDEVITYLLEEKGDSKAVEDLKKTVDALAKKLAVKDKGDKEKSDDERAEELVVNYLESAENYTELYDWPSQDEQDAGKLPDLKKEFQAEAAKFYEAFASVVVDGNGKKIPRNPLLSTKEGFILLNNYLLGKSKESKETKDTLATDKTTKKKTVESPDSRTTTSDKSQKRGLEHHLAEAFSKG